MKLIQASKDGYGFEFTLQEKQLLFKVLALYPLVPAAHHRLSRAVSAPSDENQRLLEDSLTDHRQETRQRVRTLMANPKSFQARGGGFCWHPSRAEIEWMLQVLNEVRVGSWLELGSPDLAKSREIISTPENLMHRWAMDIAGGFEMIFIAALSGELPLQTD
jgi:hypothetical protein